MTASRITAIFVIALSLILSTNVALAANKGVFKDKSVSQHQLTEWEQKKLNAEFKNRFNPANSSASNKLGGNPWKAKKAKQQQHSKKMLQLSNTWGSCREFSYKQRGQCYARGGDAYTCERFYDARVNHCDEKF